MSDHATFPVPTKTQSVEDAYFSAEKMWHGVMRALCQHVGTRTPSQGFLCPLNTWLSPPLTTYVGMLASNAGTNFAKRAHSVSLRSQYKTMCIGLLPPKLRRGAFACPTER